VDHQQVRSAQRCNNRVEQAHHPTRVRERRMGRFRCPVSAQRFLAAFTRIWNLFRPRRRSFTAPEYPGCAAGAPRGVADRGRVAPVIRRREVRPALGAPFSSVRLLKLTQPSPQGDFAPLLPRVTRQAPARRHSAASHTADSRTGDGGTARAAALRTGPRSKRR
jgi:hypothetical protein